jgi:GH24 family phage-related lysozyme (muramidase)
LVCLKSKNYEGAAEQFLRWKYYTDPVTKEKKVSNGLLNRRIDEKNLFLKPV